jgi:molybdopterin adenylyltransferase
MRAAILTVSTSVAGGAAEDRSGPELAKLVAREKIEVAAQAVVADDAGAIIDFLQAQVTAGVDFVFTTGGTGLTRDDITPEATRVVIERDAPGFAEAMRVAGQRYNELALLGRGVSGIAGRTLIVNFPGSPKAVGEMFPVIAPALPHASATLRREDGRHPGD